MFGFPQIVVPQNDVPQRCPSTMSLKKGASQETGGSAKKDQTKTKSPRGQIFWHVGFGISLFTAVLSPQQPQARNVVFATATAVAATTHHLARHVHQFKEYVDWFMVSTPHLSANNARK